MAKNTLDLTGKWQFREYPLSARRMRDLDCSGWHQTSVPCSIFHSLAQAGRIDQKQLNSSPEEFSWVSEKPWVFRKVFDCPAELLQSDRIDLVFDGLDTVAHVWLNSKLIGRCSNMFIPLRLDVTGLLKPADNTLLVKFDPSAEFAGKLADRYGILADSAVMNPFRVYIRKAQYQFGSDFCPALAGCGIWQPVRLEGIKTARFKDVHIRTIDCNELYADIRIAVKLDKIKDESLLCNITLSRQLQAISQKLTFDKNHDFHSTVIRVEKPALWHPSGYGQQNMYNISLDLLKVDELIDRSIHNLGIRTVRLNRSPDEHGRKFTFEINGIPVYARGCCWIPPSLLPGSACDYEQLLSKAADANINMLRVWAGGYYENEQFYALCDRLGIMVWQDFMFASDYYPDRRWFLDEVEKEARSIVKRLRNHCCIALWCGNNEIDWMHHKGTLGKGKKFYGKSIYHRILPRIVGELDGDRDYVPSTPSGDDPAGPNDTNSGTVHQWDVWSGFAPVNAFVCPADEIPRFVAEFGLQSLPDVETVREFCSDATLPRRASCYEIEKHNYQPEGNSRLHRYVSELFGCTDDLQRLIYLSQLTQARAAKLCVEHLRAHNFRNSGVLFRQFNDSFPAITFSALDFTGRPKALYYYAKHFFSPLLVTIVPEFDKQRAGHAKPAPPLCSLTAVIVNDSPDFVSGRLICRLIDLSGNILDMAHFPLSISPHRLSNFKLPKTFVYPENPHNSAVLCRVEKNDLVACENLYFYLPDKYIDWPIVHITPKISPLDCGRWKLSLKSDTIAKDVQILCPSAAQFSDNFFDLVPAVSRAEPPQLEFNVIIDCSTSQTGPPPFRLNCVNSSSP